MVLFLLLLVPVAIGLFGVLFSNGRVTWKEFLVHEGVVIALISLAYVVALHSRMADVETWNGVIAKKWKGWNSCCHSYPCNPHPCGCDKDGNCSTCWDTCYEHTWDDAYYAETSNGESAYASTCHRPGSGSPARWNAIQIGEPTAVEHSYQNYIKGNPDSLMRRQGAAKRFGAKLPKYPEVYDYYRSNRFLAVGVPIANLPALNERLSEINARLGAAKKVNIVVVAVNEADQSYLEALRESWIGGKINDTVVVVGMPDYPAIAWAGVISWTKSEEVKVDLRNRILDLKTFDGERLLSAVEAEVGGKYAHRPMSDFEYLKATIEPSTAVKWWIFIIGVLMAAGLEIYFWRNDPFGDDGWNGSFRRYRR